MNDNNPDYFPKLNFFEFQRYFSAIGKGYKVIDRIKLYPGRFPKYDYIVVAEAKKIDDANHPLYNAYNEFIFDWCFENPCDILYRSLLGVYKGNRREQKEQYDHDRKYRRWRFIRIEPNQDLSELKDLLDQDYCWTVYKKEQNLIAKGIMKSAKPEIEFLCDKIKRVRVKGVHKNKNLHRQQAVKDAFLKNKKIFKYIKMEFLEDYELYNFYDKFTRGFRGRLLQKVLNAKGFSFENYQALLREYNDL